MTKDQLKELVQFIGNWLWCEKKLLPNSVKFSNVVALYEPLRRYFISHRYSLEPEVTSPLEKRGKAGERKLFDFGYFKTGGKRFDGMIEVKRTGDCISDILSDIAKLQALSIGRRLLLIVGDAQPSWANNNEQFLSFDINNPERVFQRENDLFDDYWNKWRTLVSRRKNTNSQNIGRGYSANFKTILINSYQTEGIFVALWEIKSTVGGSHQVKNNTMQ